METHTPQSNPLTSDVKLIGLKTTLRYHFTPGRMAVTDKINSISVDKDVETLKSLQHSWWECKMVHLFWKQFDGFLKRYT